ncbi:hypothetical protein VW23_025700 [Devosia insulae DS-56]|uniref:N-acetyltransferase domain-containing protein n=2 Tax=Devosia insulae TaxID=408174 RepID=A0A1E5XLG4_9HYPH|nr:hypothetical protein VW23_025700 [Devosia insulae DS-56]
MSMPGTGGGDRKVSTVSWAEANLKKIGMLTGRVVEGEASRPWAFVRIEHGLFAEIEALAAGTWLIQGFGVDPDWLDRGVERLLLNEAVRRASSAGLSGVSTIVGRTAQDLIAWFKGEGFTARAECGGAYGAVAAPVTWVLLVRETVH